MHSPKSKRLFRSINCRPFNLFLAVREFDTIHPRESSGSGCTHHLKLILSGHCSNSLTIITTALLSFMNYSSERSKLKKGPLQNASNYSLHKFDPPKSSVLHTTFNISLALFEENCFLCGWIQGCLSHWGLRNLRNVCGNNTSTLSMRLALFYVLLLTLPVRLINIKTFNFTGFTPRTDTKREITIKTSSSKKCLCW